MKWLFLLTLICSFGHSVLAADSDGDGFLDLLDVGVFDPSATGEADFARRDIEDLDGANLLANLQGLQLDNNQIASIERGDFAGLTNLQGLNLGGNPITSIESGGFEGLTNLEELSVGGSHITRIERGDFDGLPNLRVLMLLFGRVMSIERGAFDGLINLQSLNLGYHPITSIENGAFDGLINLQYLGLGGNPITPITVLNFEGATFESLGPCSPVGTGLCVGDDIANLILDNATLSLTSFDAIVSEMTSITDVSLIGLTFSDENPSNLSKLLVNNSLNRVTVGEALFGQYSDEFSAFAEKDGNTLTIVPDLLPALLGDFNINETLDSEDIDLLSTEIREGTNDPRFDITNDGLVNRDDHSIWVRDSNIAGTYFGDANLDGEFNSGDLVAAFSAGEYEDSIPFNSGWATGDWNGDGDFTSSDLVVAFAHGGYEQGKRPAMVPEPAGFVIVVMGLICAPFVPRSRRNSI